MANTPPDTPPAKPRRKQPFTAARRRQFLLHLTRLGVVQQAARATGIHCSTAYLRARRDRNFAEQWAAALGQDMDLMPALHGNHAAGAMPKKIGRRRNIFHAGKQERFLTILSDTSNVRHAAAMAGIDLSTVYKRRACDAGFRTAWEEAMNTGFEDLAMDLLSRARFGTSRPIVYGGKQTGEVKVLNDTLALKLLDRFDLHCRRSEERAARIGEAGSMAAVEKRIADLRARLLQTRPDLVKDDGYDAMIAARDAGER